MPPDVLEASRWSRRSTVEERFPCPETPLIAVKFVEAPDI
jgi:hypothetical protein